MNQVINQRYRVFVLPNGLRCIHIMTQSMAEYIGVAINAGSADDGASTPGLAHFVEHGIFKGTKNRSSWHISNRMESIGGDINAYTSRQETMIYTVSPAGNTERAIELLYDMIANCDFPDSEIDKERDVIIEEINSYSDNPSDVLYDTNDEMVFAGSEMAHNILGTKQSVKNITTAQAREFVDRYYVPENMVVYVSSAGDTKIVERIVTKYFSRLNHPKPKNKRIAPPPVAPFREVIEREGHQAHTLVGKRIFDLYDNRRFALQVLSHYMVMSGMNARLVQELRERRGLAYTVAPAISLYQDCGYFGIYFGADRKMVDKSVKIIGREFAKAAESPMKPRTFEKLKNQFLGCNVVASDRTSSVARALSRSLLYYNEVMDSKKFAENIRAVTAEEVRKVAELLTGEYCVLTVC